MDRALPASDAEIVSLNRIVRCATSTRSKRIATRTWLDDVVEHLHQFDQLGIETQRFVDACRVGNHEAKQAAIRQLLRQQRFQHARRRIGPLVSGEVVDAIRLFDVRHLRRCIRRRRVGRGRSSAPIRCGALMPPMSIAVPCSTNVATGGASGRPDKRAPDQRSIPANDSDEGAKPRAYRVDVFMVLLIIRPGRASVRRARTTARSGRARSIR